MTNKMLDVSVLEQATKKYNSVKQVEIPIEIEGKTQIAVLDIDEVFKASKVRNCVEEFISRAEALKKLSGSRFHEVVQAYLQFLVIKHFTSFPAPEEYKEQVVIINMMTELGLLNRIYVEFNQEELKKILDEVNDAVDLLEDNINIYVNIAKEMGIVKEE